MNGVLLDTHAWAWSLTDDARLPPGTRDIIGTAAAFYVSPISFFEIGQKVRLNKWPEMVPHVDRLPDLLDEQGGLLATFTPVIALRAAMMEWQHRDPFDRILAATADAFDLPLISADGVFDGRLRRLW